MTTTAFYLDPYLDGERSHPDTGSTFCGRLAGIWEEGCRRREGNMMMGCPIPSEIACAAYIKHGLTKLNVLKGFGDPLPGLGRPNRTEHENITHYKRIGEAMVEALERDFTREERGPLGNLTADQIGGIARLHLEGLYSYKGGLDEALANANRSGEENRRAERLRIWGYA